MLLLADTLGLERHAIRVVAGATGRDKIVELTGLTRDEVETRLDAVGREKV